MNAGLSAHGAPRTAEVLRRLQRHARAIEPPESDAATQTEQPTKRSASNEVFHSLVILAAQRGPAPHSAGRQDMILTARPSSNPGAAQRVRWRQKHAPRGFREEARAWPKLTSISHSRPLS
jgi:hypothetical protein